MKRSLILIFAFFYFIVSDATPPQVTGLHGKDLKNALKLNLPPFFFKTYSLQYERSMLRNFSACVQAGYNSQLHLGSYINQVMNNVPNKQLEKIRAKVSLTELYTTSNMYFTPELRLYISRKGSPHGLYIAPYLRFSSSRVYATFIYKDSNSAAIPIVFTGSLRSTHPGVMLGYQRSIFKRFVIDVWLAGLQFGSSKASFDANADFGKIDKQGFTDFVQDNFKYGDVTVTVDSDAHAKIDYSGKSYGFRSGIWVGFRF